MTVADAVEDVLSEIGFGRWQALILVMTAVSQTVGPVQQLSSPILSAPVPFRCYHRVHDRMSNTSVTRMPTDDTADFPSQCVSGIHFMGYESPPQHNDSTATTNKLTTGLLSCPEVAYDKSIFQSTVITEWNLICEKSTLRPLYQMTYSIGAILGSPICGQLSDWLGRKRTFQIGSFITTMTVLATSIAPWYSIVIALRILTGMGTILMLFPAYTLLSEVSPSNRRTITTIIIGLTYFMALSALGGIGYLIPHWRKLLLICNSPLLIVVPLTFLIDESPRWLLQRGRATEAVDLLRKAAKQNRVDLKHSTSLILDQLTQIPKDILIERQGERGRDPKNQGTLQMIKLCFSSPGMRRIFIVLPLIWFLQRALYVGIVINANNFTSSNPFEYVALSGAMGVLSMILSVPISVKLPRKTILVGSLSTGGLLIFVELAVPSAYWMVKWIMVMAAFCIACGAFQINYIFAAELYPTVIRTRGFTFTSLIASVGEMVIPLVTEIAVQYQWWSASVTLGLAGITGALLLPLLPETMNRPMPETLQDAEDRYWRNFKGNDALTSQDKTTKK